MFAHIFVHYCKFSRACGNNSARNYRRTFVIPNCSRDGCTFVFDVCDGKEDRLTRVSVAREVTNPFNASTMESDVFQETLPSVVLFAGTCCTCSVLFTLLLFFPFFVARVVSFHCSVSCFLLLLLSDVSLVWVLVDECSCSHLLLF